MKHTRRVFLTAASGVAVGTRMAAASVQGANNRVRVAIIGTGGRARGLMSQLKPVAGVEIVAVCDVFEPRLLQAAEIAGPAAAKTAEYRRFKIKFHTEDQPISVYALIAQKRDPRLKQADPASRLTCKRTVATNATGLPLATLTCQNTTLAQLAEKLPAMAPAYVNHPAIDSSGLDGGWDFALSWTPRANFDGGGQRGEPGAAGASDPNGGLSLFEGVQRLGLKLEVQKHPYPVLVIDHMEQKPADN